MDGLPRGNITGICRPEGARLDRKTWRFVPGCWDWLDAEEQALILRTIETLSGRLMYRPPATWQRIIRLEQALARLRATVLMESLDEAGFWERDQ